MSDKPKPPFDSAAKKALVEERATEGAQAMSEYKAAREAERSKMVRLKALRLAKEAAERSRESPAMIYEGIELRDPRRPGSATNGFDDLVS